MAERGGHSRPVRVVSAAELRENGGEYVLRGSVAIPVTAFSIGQRQVLGGPAIPVYVVSDAEIASGKFSVAGGGDTPVIDNASLLPARLSGSRWATPVYDSTGSLGAQPVVPPAPASAMLLETGDVLLTELAGRLLLETM